MANHKSAKKRIRQTETRKLENKYFARSTRNALKELRDSKDKAAATELLPKVSSMIDKLAKRNTIHENKAANIKSSITKHVNSL